MMVALLVLGFASLVFWLVFFRFKLIRLTPGWGVIFGFFVVHLLLVFVIGLRFMTPNSANATVVQRTIQLVPRLPEPTLVSEVLVQEDVPVKKGQPLFQFDRRPYQYKVDQIAAQLAAAKQNVNVLKADVDAATQGAKKAKVELDFTLYQKRMFDKLAQEQAVREDDVEQWLTRANAAQATLNGAEAQLQRAVLQYTSEIDGVNTSVANLEAQLQSARYYLDNTTLTAPEDGRIINLQVRPGMVSGTIRLGGIAALIADADRYLLATYFQENLKYVKVGQSVEIALDLYPGQIFRGTVDSIWRGNGIGQYLPSDDIPKFQQPPPTVPQGQYAVKIRFDHPDQSKFPIGAQGSAAIYTLGEHGAWAVLRKISIRAHSWFNWLYPLNI
jgi:multidrug resistance efflux pump